MFHDANVCICEDDLVKIYFCFSLPNNDNVISVPRVFVVFDSSLIAAENSLKNFSLHR